MKKTYLLSCLLSLPAVAQEAAATAQTSRGGLYWFIEHPFQWTWVIAFGCWFFLVRAVKRYAKYKDAIAQMAKKGNPFEPSMDKMISSIMKERIFAYFALCVSLTGSYLLFGYVYTMFIQKR